MTQLILISGPPAVGKSTLAKKIANAYKWVHLDKDCIDEPFSPNDRGEHYTRSIEPNVIQALLNLAELNLNNKMSVIIDVPWTHLIIHNPSLSQTIHQLCAATQSVLKIIELAISAEILRARMAKRGLERDKVRLTEAGWKEFIMTDCIGQLIPLEHYLVDASEDVTDYLPGVLKYLAQ